MASPDEFGFSAMLKDVVLFFSAERGGGVLVRAGLLLLVVIGDVSKGVGCLVAFFLSKFFFFFFNVFDNSFLRLRCAGVLSLDGFESVFYWDCHWLRAPFLLHDFVFFVVLFLRIAFFFV